MAVTQPDRKAVRTREVVGIDLRNCWNRRQSGYDDLDPGRGNDAGDSDCDACQNRRSNPNSKSAIFRVVNGLMCCVEWDHIVFGTPPHSLGTSFNINRVNFLQMKQMFASTVFTTSSNWKTGCDQPLRAGLQAAYLPPERRGLHRSLVARRTVLCAQGSRKIAF